MIELERKMWKFIDRNKIYIFFIIVTVISLLFRSSLLSNSFGDYDSYLKPWFEELKANGGLNALKLEIGNYNAPYMTILALLTYLPVSSLISIKFVSIIFDYVCAIVIVKIALLLLKDNKEKKMIALIIYSFVVFMPTVFLNSACWAQSDSIYTAFILLSLLYMLKQKYIKTFIFLGIAFSFKMQAIFVLPLYFLIYISERKFSILNLLWSIVAAIVMCLPSIIFGNTLSHCLNVYIDQAATYSEYITLNFPNIYSIFWGSGSEHLINTPNGLVFKMGIIITIALFVLIAFLVLYKKVKFDGKAIVEFALWSVLICTFFLPSMHERYLFVGDVLGILYLLLNKEKWYIPLGIELVSIYGYLYLLFSSFTIEMKYMGILYFVLFVIYSKDMCKKYFV